MGRGTSKKRGCCCGCPTLIVLGLVVAVLMIRHVPAWPPKGVTKVSASEGCKRPDWSPDGNSLLFDRWPSGGVGYIDLNEGKTHIVCDQGFEPSWFGDGKRILVMRDSGVGPGATATLPVVYALDGEQLWTFNDAGLRFEHGHVDRKSGRIYGVTAVSASMDSIDSSLVVELDIESNKAKVVTSETIDAHPSHGVRWSPDGRRAAYRTVARSGGSYRLVIGVSDVDGTNSRVLLGPHARLSDPAWSPDGKWIAVLAVRPSVGRQVTDFANGVSGVTRAGNWLANGITKAVGKAPDTVGELWVLSVDGESAQRVLRLGATRDVYSAAFATNPPAWSPDGSRIAIVKDKAIWIVPVGDLGGKESRRSRTARNR